MAKQIFLFRRFAHRRNADASFDSICLACYLTVGTALVDVALQGLESDHQCEPWGFGQLSQRTRSVSSLSTLKGMNLTINCLLRQAAGR
jgi:hypothetical protein